MLERNLCRLMELTLCRMIEETLCRLIESGPVKTTMEKRSDSQGC